MAGLTGRCHLTPTLQKGRKEPPGCLERRLPGAAGNTKDEGSDGEGGPAWSRSRRSEGPEQEQQGSRGHCTGLAAALGTRGTLSQEGVV